jgi:hypothetical protein
MSQAESKRSAARSVRRIIPGAKRRGIVRLSDNETRALETKCTETRWSNYTLCKPSMARVEELVVVTLVES